MLIHMPLWYTCQCMNASRSIIVKHDVHSKHSLRAAYMIQACDRHLPKRCTVSLVMSKASSLSLTQMSPMMLPLMKPFHKEDACLVKGRTRWTAHLKSTGQAMRKQALLQHLWQWYLSSPILRRLHLSSHFHSGCRRDRAGSNQGAGGIPPRQPAVAAPDHSRLHVGGTRGQ
jgi:hypothetical protein